MKRQVTMAVVACLAMGSLIAFAPTVAGAQTPDQTACFPPGETSDYPPSSPDVEPSLSLDLSSGFLLPGHTDGHLRVTGAVPGLTYCGIAYSTPITIEPQSSSDSGVLDFAGLTVPSDFELNAAHHLDVYRQATLVGAFDFCVDSEGGLTALSSGSCTSTSVTAVADARGSLPKTGWDHLVQILKIAALVIALGVFLLYVRRRRAAGVVQA